eukprot:TRINITY_DN15701_c0_g1_i1.p1 TRINITY_DN15701_c0_g1~~TRINITY_DN15701_c0_g1_i1.p1  ORF type:complete len:337 (-),score=37.14 TRINITY_DN15701_c0_g1_i1:381-1391(-)
MAPVLAEFTAQSQLEARDASLLCNRLFNGDKVLSIMVMRYLLVPRPVCLVTLRRLYLEPFMPRGRKGRGKGLGKGPKSLQATASGALIIGDPHSRILSRITPQAWGRIAGGRPSSSEEPDGTLPACKAVQAGVDQHAAVAAWEAGSSCIQRRCAYEHYRIHAAVLDEEGGDLCLILTSLELVRQSADRVCVVGSVQHHVSESATWQGGCLDVAVLGKDWYIADLHGHQLLKYEESVGCHSLFVRDAFRGSVRDLQEGQIAWPKGIAIDAAGVLYVTQDTGFVSGQLVRICRKRKASTLASGLRSPGAVALSEQDVLFAEAGSRRVVRLRRSTLDGW